MSKSKQTKDFFVSYNKADRQWAEWIAWELEAAGYGVIIQAWDFAGNFVLEMDRAHREAARTVAVLSPDYLEAMYTKPEWAARFAQDPTGRDDRLIPVRVREVELEGLLAQIVYVDLLGLSEAEASERLLQRARRERAKPARRPTFPGDRAPAGKPAFPPAVPPRPRGRPPEICTLPASTADFIGREAELAHLANILAAGGRAGISAVTGMGGIGKTALAVEAAQRAAERFPDGMLFLDLGGFGPSPLAPEAALANLIAQVEPTLKPPEGLAQLGAAYRSLLAGRRMLLLLDNARDPAQLRPLLPPEPVALLATSRVPLRLPGVQPLELDALPLAEALALLRSALHRRPADDADLDRIAAAGAFLAEHRGRPVLGGVTDGDARSSRPPRLRQRRRLRAGSALAAAAADRLAGGGGGRLPADRRPAGRGLRPGQSRPRLGRTWRDPQGQQALRAESRHRPDIGDLRGENTAPWNLALAHEELDDRERAVELAKQSLTIHRAMEDPFAPKIESWLRERGRTP